MNKTQQYIIHASLFALACALFGGLWLIWQTIEESRALERQNRELQASLEASRIRVENFCEYPTDVLCRVDERSGTVAGALPGELPGLAELAGIPAPEVAKKDDAPAPEASPAKALENVQKVAQAQAKISEPAREKSAPFPAPAVKPTAEKPVAAAPAKVEEKNKARPGAENKKAVPVEKPEEKAALPAEKKSPANAEAPAAQKETSKTSADVTPAPESKGGTAPNPAAELKSTEPAKPAEQQESAPLPAAPAYQQEFSGKLSDTLLNKEKAETAKPVPVAPKKDAPAVKPDAAKTVSKAASVGKQGVEPRSTWSRIDLDGEIFAFTLTGSGPSLNASGKLLASPWRYELTLDGLWSIRSHEVVPNRLVNSVKCSVRNGSTVVIFMLKKKPYKASLHRPDARTVSVRIR